MNRSVHTHGNRKCLALAVLCIGAAWGQPSYSAAGIVNASNYVGGPFAPGSILSIFGTQLARSAYALQGTDLVACGTVAGMCLPPELNYVRVYVQDQPVGMLYVSANQINFVMSSVQLPGVVNVRVVTEGLTGPEVPVTLVAAAPALFPQTPANGYLIATSAANQLLTAANPAHSGDIVVIYLTGLGMTSPNAQPGEVTPSAWSAVAVPKVTLNGTAVDPTLVKYAGLTPGCSGLYQINLYIPAWAGTDPELEVSAAGVVSQTGLKLPVQ
jgi:uncharacterized protein (TIGR03437 family)